MGRDGEDNSSSSIYSYGSGYLMFIAGNYVQQINGILNTRKILVLTVAYTEVSLPSGSSEAIRAVQIPPLTPSKGNSSSSRVVLFF